MTSRRQMTRSFSANGRTSSFSEDEGSSSNGRTESRNMYLSNVRPENSYSRYSHHRPTRSTLCSVMAQLTEDIQPSFDTTLKSKAVSENCNVKFTCVVSGYPAPELKWYKDDTEMDRYCGLPKYEIRRNGKTHTLHIYNCTLDDAAIYQVSASNSKGIVSCSGVLEVGTMSEFQIHQRFFAKLKQKAERKRKDLDEQTKKKDKEKILKEKPQISPERPPRKRHIPLPQDRPVVKEPDAIEQVGAAAEANGVTMEMGLVTSTNSGLEKEAPLSMDTLAKKKIKISDGVDLGVNSSSSSSDSNRSHIMGNGGENCYDGGRSLAQFMAETLTSQAAEEKQSRAEINASIVNDTKDGERMQKESEERVRALVEEREKRREEDLALEKESEEERPLEMLHTTAHGKHPGKASKDHDHHNIQTSITSMLHTVKDFFFGKSKKDSHDQTENKNRVFDHDSVKPPQPETPPSFWLKPQPNPDGPRPLIEDIVPMETNDLTESSESADVVQPLVSLETHKHKEKENDDPHLPAAEKMPPAQAEETTGQRVEEADGAVEVMEVSLGAGSSSPSDQMSLSELQVLTELEHKDSQVVSFIEEVPVNQQESDCLVVSPQPDRQATGDESPSGEEISVSTQAKAHYEEECPPATTVTSLEVSWIPAHSALSASDNPSLGQAPSETLQEEQLSVDKACEDGEPDAEDSRPSSQMCEKEKAEVKSSEQARSDINRSEMTELMTPSLEERIETCESKTPDQVISRAPAVAAYNAERDGVKEETKYEEVTEGFPPTTGQESLETVDLETQHECTVSIVVESEEVHNLRGVQSSTSGFRGNEERGDFKPDLPPEEALGFSLWDNLKREEHTVSDVANAEARNRHLQLEVETEKRVEEVDVSKVCLVTQNEGSNAILLEEHSKITHEDGGERQPGWPSENMPQIQISIIDDDKDVEPAVPDVNKYEQFIIPKIEIMESELKECTVLDFNKPESEPAILQKHDATQITIIQEKGMTDSPGLPPTQKGMQNNYSLSPTETVADVAQLCDETEMSAQGQPHMKRSDQLPQTDYTSVPLINVLCTDDKENDAFVNARASHALQPLDTQMVPLFVVPPISITCHESCPGVGLPTHSEWTETEMTNIQRGTEPDVGDHMSLTSEKGSSEREKLEEVAEKLEKESTPRSLREAPIKKAGNNVLLLNNPTEKIIVPENFKIKPSKEAKTETLVSVEEVQRNRFSIERLSSKPPAHPSLSPSSLRKFMSKAAPDSDNETAAAVPVITVGDHQSDKVDEDLSGGSTPTSPLSCESSPRLKRRDSLTLIRSATPEELASGARRKIFIPKTKEDGDAAVAGVPDAQGKKETPYMSPSQARRAALLQAPKGQNTPPMERRSPLLNRRKATLEVPKVMEETPKEEPVRREEKPAEKKLDPLKAPQVIRKIRGEPFPDASGHLKLWCMFFNVLSDSTIKWYRDEEEILEVKRSGGDESQVALAIVLASSQDCGVYGCTINNEYGTDTTDFLLSEDILSEILLKDDLEVGEEIEMTPLLFTKGLVDCGSWGEKYFGRIMTEIVHLGQGCNHKACRVKVIYGLDPVFDSGSNCIIKVQSPIAYGTKQESNLAERNLEITKQECKIQNMIREYCKIFAAEARVNENFGFSLEVIPKYLMYRPANTVPYATVEASLEGVFLKYCMMDTKGGLITRTISEVEQKCCTFQHWIHQWTHGNLLVTRLEGVETKLTNIGVVTKSKGYQGLTERGSPEVFEQFQTQHQCNYYCGLLGLRPMKSMDGQKGSRSPLLNRKLSPLLQRKGHSPQMSRKTNSSPKVTRKVQETEDNKTDAKSKPAETVDGLEMR